MLWGLTCLRDGAQRYQEHSLFARLLHELLQRHAKLISLPADLASSCR